MSGLRKLAAKLATQPTNMQPSGFKTLRLQGAAEVRAKGLKKGQQKRIAAGDSGARHFYEGNGQKPLSTTRPSR